MKYNAFISSASSESDASCAIIIVPDKGEMIKKILPFKDCTANKADLQGIKYIDCAIQDDNADITINSTNAYIVGMVDKNKAKEWSKTPKQNEELVKYMREKVESKRIKIIYGSGIYIEKVKWWAKSIYRLKDGIPEGGKTPLEV